MNFRQTQPDPSNQSPLLDSHSTTVSGCQLDVVLLPSLVEPDHFQGKAVVVVDVLRATTTITTAISNGCQRVLPQPTIESAKSTYSQLESAPATLGTSMMGGERRGRIVPGFHRGNSPIEYTPDVIDGKTLILATTNGTVAMERCRQARRVLMGAMVNLEAIAQSLLHENQVAVLCSGTDRRITGEDVLFAGALVDRIMQARERASLDRAQLTDPASIAAAHWASIHQQVQSGSQALGEYFRKCRGGVNLSRIGHDADIDFAANIDSVPVVPELDLNRWEIRATANDAPGDET